MTLHYVNQIKNNISDVYLFGEIGYEVNGAYFASDMKFLDNDPSVSEIHVHINTPGGNVLDGLSIYHAIKNVKKPTKTIVVGIAASMGGIISQAGSTREIMDYGKIMIHNPFNANGDNEGDMDALVSIKDILSSILESNTKIDKSAINAYMDKETWLDAESALEYGFADVVISSKRKQNNGGAIVQKNVFTPHNELVQMANNFKPKPKQKMKEVTNFLKLSEDATEELVLSAIQDKVSALDAKAAELTEIQSKLSEKESEVEALKAAKTALEAKNKALLDEKAVSIVDNAIAAGKFKQEDKTSLIEDCKKDIAAFENLVSKIAGSKSYANIMDSIDNSSADNLPEQFKGKTLREIEKQDGNAVKELKNNYPTLYKKLYKEEYGVEVEL
jgi:ATP-dependent Clp endopeptidase proteolytic subunit ClpP